MTRNEFMEEIKNEVLSRLPEQLKEDLNIQEVTITKTNDQKHHGLTFRKGEAEAAPTLYLDEAFERFNAGEDIQRLAAEVADAYRGTIGMERPQTMDLSFDQVKENLTLRLLDISRNREYLSQTPYMTVGHGLAMVCDIKMEDGRDGSWRATITQDMLEHENYDKRELFVAAMENAPNIDPPILVDMNQALFSREGNNLMVREGQIERDDISPMYVLSNESGMLGSAALYYPQTREKIAEVLGDSYSVLPSSVHEVLIVPDSAGIDTKDLCSMVREANRSVVEAKDVLSDTVLHYDRERGSLEFADQSRERGDIGMEKGA